MPQTTVLVMFGGRSPEHDVSIVTGLQVLQALNPEVYRAIPLYIAPDGRWWTGDLLAKRETYIPGPATLKKLTPVTLDLSPSSHPRLLVEKKSLFGGQKHIEFDVAIPSFHGLVGEDGAMQGLLDVANVPYAGMRRLASCILMDKAATKRALAGTDIPLLPFHEIFRPHQGLLLTPDELQALLGVVKFPCCVKPSHLGSSIGVARVNMWQELSDTLPAIFRYDDTAILEPFVDNLCEYNVAVCRVGNEIRTSAIERPKHSTELLDFKTKYLSGGGSKGGTKGTKTPGQRSEGMLSLTRDINPDLPPAMEQNIRTWAAAAFAHVYGTGAPRFDFLCNSKTGELWLNEVNPWPGSVGYFLWEAASRPLLFPELLDILIKEAQAVHAAAQIPPDPTPEDARLFPRPG